MKTQVQKQKNDLIASNFIKANDQNVVYSFIVERTNDGNFMVTTHTNMHTPNDELFVNQKFYQEFNELMNSSYADMKRGKKN